MTYVHIYKYECDSFRLLIDEFEEQLEDYQKKNANLINEKMAYDLGEYQPPKYISNYKPVLTSALIVEAQALLDFFLPLMLNAVAKQKNIEISPFDRTWKGGNVLFWTKHVLKNELCVNYNFGQGPHSKLSELYEVRNDHVHHAGYASAGKNKSQFKKGSGISVCESTDLYFVEFSYCRTVIDEIEKYFSEIHGCIKA